MRPCISQAHKGFYCRFSCEQSSILHDVYLTSNADVAADTSCETLNGLHEAGSLLRQEALPGHTCHSTWMHKLLRRIDQACRLLTRSLMSVCRVKHSQKGHGSTCTPDLLTRSLPARSIRCILPTVLPAAPRATPCTDAM